MIVWLASYPRSGNTFMRVLLKNCFGLNSFSQYNDRSDIGTDSKFADVVGHHIYDESWQQFYSKATESNDRFIVKTHDAPIDSGKTIYLVRDPRSALVSFHNYLQNFSSLELKRKHTILGATAFGSWGEHIMSWRPDKRDDTLVVYFEQLVKDPIAIAQSVGEFIGLDMVDQKIPSFAELKKISPNFFRSGSDEKNIAELDPQELNLINFLFRKQMKMLGYETDDRVNRNDALNSVLGISKDIWTLQYDFRKKQEEHATLMNAKEKELREAHGAELANARADHSEMFDQLLNSVNSSGTQAEALAKQSIALTEKFEKTNDQLEGLWKQKSELGATVEVLRNIRTQLSDENDHLKTENRGLQAELATLRQEVTEAASAVIQANQKIEDLWKQRSALDAKIEVLSNNKSSLQDEHDKARSQNEDLISEIATHIKMLDQKERQILDAKSKIEVLAEKVKQQNAESKKLDAKIAYRDRALEALRLDLASAKAFAESNLNETLALRSSLTSERERVDKLQNMITQFSSQRIAREELVRELEQNLALSREKAQKLARRNQELSSKYAETKEQYLEMNAAVAPRMKSILTLKPMRYVWNKRRLVKRGEIQLDPLGLPVPNATDTDLPANIAEPIRGIENKASQLEQRQPKPSIYSSYEMKKPLGIAIYTFDRADSVESVLESLLLQDGLQHAHVWIDGDQGNPKRRKLLDETEKLVNTFPVKQVHRNRGNYGFRKMMIVSMRKMFEMYDRVLFLEDDCFPTRHALKGFSLELDRIENDDSVFSVYGHPFLTEQEKTGPIGRFQGWGWASTRDKLMPIWPSLLDAYLMSEDEYKNFINAELTDEVLKHIDVTPGRQPSSTFTKFFAWDEVLCFLTGQKGLTHQRTTERLIYNFGVGDSSTHFGNIDHYRKPPFNMVSINEIWEHF